MRTKEQKSEYMKQRYKENRQHCLANAVAWATKNKDKKAARSKELYESRQLCLREIKNKPCMDCGGSFPACAMDFDHRPGEIKIGLVSNLMAHGRIKAFELEIKKCDLVCANCHRIRTFNRNHIPSQPVCEIMDCK